MDLMRVRYAVFGDTLISRELERLGNRATNMQLVFRVMARRFYRREKELFATHGFGMWDHLKPETIAAKARSSNARTRSNADKPLRATNTLYRSLTQPNARYSKRTIRGIHFELGTADPKAVHHYYGAPRGNLPARPPIMFMEVDKIQWVKDIQRYLITGEVPTL